MSEQGGPATVTAAPGEGSKGNAAKPTATPKWARVLHRLLRKPPLHRFEAERPPVSDHTLNSTIPYLEQKGVRVSRRTVKLPGYAGQPVWAAEYWIDDDDRAAALRLLGRS